MIYSWLKYFAKFIHKRFHKITPFCMLESAFVTPWTHPEQVNVAHRVFFDSLGRRRCKLVQIRQFAYGSVSRNTDICFELSAPKKSCWLSAAAILVITLKAY